MSDICCKERTSLGYTSFNFSLRYIYASVTLASLILILLQERVKAPLFCNINRTPASRYGYIANLCVAKPFRRQGVATKMLYFAVNSAKSTGNVYEGRVTFSIYDCLWISWKSANSLPPVSVFMWQVLNRYMCMWTEIMNLHWYCTKRWDLR